MSKINSKQNKKNDINNVWNIPLVKKGDIDDRTKGCRKDIHEAHNKIEPEKYQTGTNKNKDQSEFFTKEGDIVINKDSYLYNQNTSDNKNSKNKKKNPVLEAKRILTQYEKKAIKICL